MRITASDRKSLIRLASRHPKGSEERRGILSALLRVAVEYTFEDFLGGPNNKFKNKDTGNMVSFTSLPKEQQEDLQGKYQEMKKRYEDAAKKEKEKAEKKEKAKAEKGEKGKKPTLTPAKATKLTTEIMTRAEDIAEGMMADDDDKFKKFKKELTKAKGSIEKLVQEGAEFDSVMGELEKGSSGSKLRGPNKKLFTDLQKMMGGSSGGAAADRALGF